MTIAGKPARPLLVAIAVLLTITLSSLTLHAGPLPDKFTQHNLVSDLPGVAANTDPDLVNPWGIALSSSSPFWISDNKTGLATLYNGAGVKLGLVVTIPAPGPGTSAPTGQVFNSNAANFQGGRFIFSTEDGTIAAWSGGTTAALKVPATDAVFKGLAIDANSAGTYLLATDFFNGRIDVFDNNFAASSLAGTFTDPSLPAGYAPFNVEVIGGKVYVTYALQDAAKHDDVAGAGHGFVDVYDLNGNLITRLVTNGALNSPWGLALAPNGFGGFGGDLLVGNFGDGTINAFDPTTGAMLGTLDNASGNPIVNQGLWGLTFGNGGAGGDKDKLYFTAGIPGPNGQVEDNGLFGSIANAPEPGSVVLLAIGLLGVLGTRRTR